MLTTASASSSLWFASRPSATAADCWMLQADERSVSLGMAKETSFFHQNTRNQAGQARLGTLSSSSGLSRAMTPACWSTSMFCGTVRAPVRDVSRSTGRFANGPHNAPDLRSSRQLRDSLHEGHAVLLVFLEHLQHSASARPAKGERRRRVSNVTQMTARLVLGSGLRWSLSSTHIFVALLSCWLRLPHSDPSRPSILKPRVSRYGAPCRSSPPVWPTERASWVRGQALPVRSAQAQARSLVPGPLAPAEPFALIW